ncbi:hypothetical protein J6590_009437 [Homalodisca vitripennis]|nr:hypothetical protein J6590_009437 [Homalodisca vitripennis]
MQVDILTDSLESLNIQTMKLLESLVKGESAPEGGHSLQKRAVEPPNMSRSDCTNSTRQVRSVSRGSDALRIAMCRGRFANGTP